MWLGFTNNRSRTQTDATFTLFLYLIDGGGVNDAFCPVGVSQCAQRFSVVTIRWRNGWNKQASSLMGHEKSRQQKNWRHYLVTALDLLAIIIVLEFPPRLSLSSQVRMESLYGMNMFFLECCNLSDASAANAQRKDSKQNNGQCKRKFKKVSSVMQWTQGWSVIPKVDMILPRVTRDLLMLPPSLSRSPVAPEASTRSLISNEMCVIARCTM